jgi:hypothetical protein
MNPEVQLQNISIHTAKDWNKRNQGKTSVPRRQFCHSQLNECNFEGIFSGRNWSCVEDKE